MRIAFLNIYGGKVSRGAEVAVGELAKRLSRQHEVVVFQSGRIFARSPLANKSYQVIHISGIPLLHTQVSDNPLFRLLRKVYLDPYSLLVLYFSLRCLTNLFREKFDILIPINGFWQILVCKLVKLFRRGKIVVMGYAGVGFDDWVNLKLAPDAFFAMTEYAAKWTKKVNPKVHIGVVPGGVDTKRFNPRVKPRPLPLKRPIVLTVAALIPYKRVDLTIQAVVKINKHLEGVTLAHLPGDRLDSWKVRGASLVVAGNGPLKEQIERLGKTLLGDRFLRLDITYRELPSLYTACDLFTLASMHEKGSLFEKLTGQKPSEAFGIVYVEAMACGLPVVAPDDELRREIIGEAGVLVDCTNTKIYAQALKEALSRKWDDIPQKQAEKFEWNKVVAKFSRQLNQLYTLLH